MMDEPLTINSRLVNELFDDILKVLGIIQSFEVPKFQIFESQRFQDLKIPRFHVSMIPRSQDSEISRSQDSKKKVQEDKTVFLNFQKMKCESD